MILWQYKGESLNVRPGLITSGGTGQSGTVATSVTAGKVYEGAQSLKFNQLTSSGDGHVTLYNEVPRPPGATKLRLSGTFLNDNADVDLDFIYIYLVDYSQTGYTKFSLNWASEYGVTEEVQYIASGGGWVDTGFYWYEQASGGGSLWTHFEIDCDVVEKTYTRLQVNSETNMTAIPAATTVVASVPHYLIWVRLFGDNTESQIYFDNLKLEDLS